MKARRRRWKGRIESLLSHEILKLRCGLACKARHRKAQKPNLARLRRWKKGIENLFSNDFLKRRCELGFEARHRKAEQAMKARRRRWKDRFESLLSQFTEGRLKFATSCRNTFMTHIMWTQA